MVRLVKGAYWDSEIKRAQVDGLADFPVFTRKVHTDVSYLACARKLLAAPDAVFPQFATHNAQTLASDHRDGRARTSSSANTSSSACTAWASRSTTRSSAPDKLDRPCRIYAPVGTHETLLAYLVRRLLENGANSSFVNRIADPTVLGRRPDRRSGRDRRARCRVAGRAARADRAAARPLRPGARNSAGPRPVRRGRAGRARCERWRRAAGRPGRAVPAGRCRRGGTRPVRNPADHRDVVGTVARRDAAEIDAALAAARRRQPALGRDAAGRARAPACARAADALRGADAGR